MAVSKIQFDGQTLIDLTSDTVTADKLVSGCTAHKADGTVIFGALNVFMTTMTLGTHSSTNVALCTLPDDVYAHRNDDSFTVALVNTTPASLDTYDDYYLLACNNPNNPKVGNYTSYGVGLRKNSATAVGINQIFYPPKDTNNTTSLGGAGKFWLNGKVLTYKSAGYYLGAGTYKIAVFW